MANIGMIKQSLNDCILYCIVCIHSYSTYPSAYQSEVLPLTHLGAQMQWYCREIVCEELAQGPLPLIKSIFRGTSEDRFQMKRKYNNSILFYSHIYIRRHWQ